MGFVLSHSKCTCVYVYKRFRYLFLDRDFRIIRVLCTCNYHGCLRNQSWISDSHPGGRTDTRVQSQFGGQHNKVPRRYPPHAKSAGR